MMTFSEKFCAQYELPPEKYEETVLRLCLRPAARWLRWLLGLMPDYFAADRELVRSVGRLTRLADFEAEALDFAHDPNNRGFLRRRLNLRVSARQLQSLVWATWHGREPDARRERSRQPAGNANRSRVESPRP